MRNNGDISRLDFLKASSLAAAGLVFLPSFASSTLLDGNRNKQFRSIQISTYQIVIPVQADPTTAYAAQQLKQYLSEMSATEIPLVEEDKFRGNKAIYIGTTNYAKAQKINLKNLSDDGYIYKPSRNNFIISGGAKKGVLYGIYDLLELLGCKRYSPDDTYIPKSQSSSFPNSDTTIKPAITYRTTSYSAIGGQEYSDWHKISSRDDWGMFVHTFNALLSPSKYGESHPEYFSLINGTRLPGTQLCLSNQEVVDIVVANLKSEIAKKPAATYWSVSQNDNDQHCQCDACTALNKKYGGVPSGSIIYFVNKIAKEFPTKVISTLAYWYSREAPKNIKPEPNVNIMLCNIESKRQKPVFETDPAFSNDLKDWGRITNDILIWDYNIQFTNFFAPFPNLYTIKPNIKFYADNHVNALFMQANNEAAAEMAVLRSYLISKLMWDPNADENAIIDDFVAGYYGAAGSYIRQYINVMQQSLLSSGAELSIFGDPIDAKETFLSAQMMEKYQQLFDKAEAAVKENSQLLRRVQVARLPILYAEIQIGRTEIDTPRSLYRRVNNGIVIGKAEKKLLVNKFVDVCRREGVQLVRERSGSPDHFLASYDRVFTKMEETDNVKSFRKQIIPITNPSSKSKGVEGLTDGVFASYEAWQGGDENWIFYEGVHMDFIVDLGEIMPIESISMDFLNPQAQPDWHLMALPKYVTYSISDDNQNYNDPILIENPHDSNPFENPDISKISVHTFAANMNNPTKARYIKVHAESLLKMPSWHIRAGQPTSIYCDQIVVK